MKAVSFLVLFILISFLVGFPIVIWRIIRKSRGAPAARTLRRLLCAFLVFFFGGLAVTAGLFLFLNSRSDGGPAPFGVMDASKVYLEKKYGASSGWHFDVVKHAYTSADHRDGYYVVDYQSGARRGVLKATYSNYTMNKEFTFEEQARQQDNVLSTPASR